jgi:hypothetical protein
MNLIDFVKSVFCRPDYVISNSGIKRIIDIKTPLFVRWDEIAHWHIEPYMSFDIIAIRLLNGTTMFWPDRRDDLINALRNRLPNLESPICWQI